MRGMFDEYLKWPLLRDITVELVNQKKNDGHRAEVIAFGDSKNAFMVTKQERAAGGWGVATFISHAELYSRCDFINDGSIRFQITKIVHRKLKYFCVFLDSFTLFTCIFFAIQKLLQAISKSWPFLS